MSWTQEREAKLKELWSKGHTASQIAEMLGNTTRNAVIGKAHRLNLQSRTTSKKVSEKTILKIPQQKKVKVLNSEGKQNLKLYC